MPAPFRWVIGKPGDPHDESASTDFGEWFQPDDQTAEATTFIQTAHPDDGGVYPVPEGAVLDDSSNVADPPPPAEPPSEIPAFAAELASATGGTPGVSGAGWTFYHNTWHIVSGLLPGDDDPFYLSHGLSGSRLASASPIGPRPRSLLWVDAWRPAAWPVGVIGYEVALTQLGADFWAPVANPVEAHLTIKLETTVDHGRVPGLCAYAVLNRRVGGSDAIWQYAGPFLDMTLLEGPQASIVNADDNEFGMIWTDCDFTGALTPPVSQEFVITDFTHAPPNTGLVGFHSSAGKLPGAAAANPIPQDWEEGVAVEVSTNADLDTAMSYYVIRPPLIRWIYDRAPYRRTSFRSDALAGGAGRNFPPSKAHQSNRRTSGGYL